MKKELEKSQKLEDLAKNVIQKEKLDFKNAKLGFVIISPNISKTTAGRCIKTNKELNFFSNYDYIIEMSKEIWDELTDDGKYVLMFHELLHIFVKTDEKTGNDKYLLKDHGIKDFLEIIKKYGIEWFTNLKTQIALLYNFEKEENINL